MLTARGKPNYEKYKYYYGYLANNLDTKRRKVLYVIIPVKDENQNIKYIEYILNL